MMRKLLIILLPVLLLVWSCTSAPVKRFVPEQLTGSWRLTRTEYKGVTRSYPPVAFQYKFGQDGVLVSKIGGRVFRGQWVLKADRLYAWWPGRHKEGHRIVSISRTTLVLLSSDGGLRSWYQRVEQE